MSTPHSIEGAEVDDTEKFDVAADVPAVGASEEIAALKIEIVALKARIAQLERAPPRQPAWDEDGHRFEESEFLDADDPGEEQPRG